jgi:hypothetical protein
MKPSSCVLLLPILVGSMGCPATDTQSVSPGSDSGVAAASDDEEAAVYAAVIGDTGGKMLLIKEQTATGHDGVSPAETVTSMIGRMHDVAPATTENFLAQNATAHPLRADMALGAPYVLLSQTDPIWSDPNFWPILRARYPEAMGIPKGVGYSTLSRVGFNASKDQALVYMGTEAEFLVGDHYAGHGAGTYYLMKKVNGVWTVDQQVTIWTT